MKCKKIKKNLLRYFEKQLDEVFSQKIAEHLNNCTQCNEEYKLIKNMQDALLNLEEIEPTSDYKDKFWNKVANTSPQIKLITYKKYILPIAASVIIIIALVISLNKIYKISETSSQLTQQDLKDIEFINEIEDIIESPLITNPPAILLTEEEINVLQTNEIQTPNYKIKPEKNNEVYLRKIKEVKNA